MRGKNITTNHNPEAGWIIHNIMSTYTQILYQIVFSTKERTNSLSENNQEELYRYIWGIFKEKRCILYQIGGVSDHIHIITHIHPTIAVADLIKDIKVATSVYIKEKNLFPSFNGWQDGYGAFTYSINAKESLVSYVKNQKEHHTSISFKDEYIALLKEHHIDFNEKYLL